MPRNVLNLELSSGGFSAGALVGDVALDASFELSAEPVMEPERAVSGARSDMLFFVCVALDISLQGFQSVE